MSQDEIYAKVADVLQEALNVDQEEVKPNSTLQGDLGAESIDTLDIVFRLEREFNIRIPRGEMLPDFATLTGNHEFVQNGRVTPEGLIALKKQMACADFSKFEKNPEVTNLWDLLTVEYIIKYIDGRLN